MPLESLNKPVKSRLAGYSPGLLFTRSLRRVMRAAGYSVFPGWLGAWGHDVAVWGRIPKSLRVLKNHTSVVTFEDAFLRSVSPGLSSPPIGLNIDYIGVYFDCRTPSTLEQILQSGDLSEGELLQRAQDGRAFLQHYGLSKYSPVPRGYGAVPDAGYVLVVDQVKGDASIVGALADANSFAEMLQAARDENPDSQILIRAHPSNRDGHFRDTDCDARTAISRAPLNPWDVLEGASKVYCISSQLGFEAIMAGHRPHVFGVPFYAGWGLSEDRQCVARRARKLTVDQLFAGAMLAYPFWYNHARRAACDFEEATQQLLSEARHHWDGLQSSAALGMRLWKRHNVARFLGKVRFMSEFNRAEAGEKLVVWAGRESPDLVQKCTDAGVDLVRMEDGFIRSKGLGAELVPAASLVLDDLGIYYDPTGPSRLEMLIGSSVDLPDFAIKRAANLRALVVAKDVSKYNLPSEPLPEIPSDRQVILVPGQVQDDASIRLGAGDVNTNLALLRAARAANPQAFIIYKPHPDVVAGLRSGVVSAEAYCDVVSTANTLDLCDEVWTMTSLLGFEALLRGKKVTCLGMPFYAGWGLTKDLGQTCARRNVQVSLDGLVHATLIDYPRYKDAKSGLACTPELLVERLAAGTVRQGILLRVLSKIQGVFASYASIWR